MDVRVIDSEQDLEHFFSCYSHAEFLQSWAWGVFQERFGRESLRLGVWEGGALVGVATCFRHSLPFGKAYWYCPRGPIFSRKLSDENRSAAFHLLLGEFRKRFATNSIFIRLEPSVGFPDGVSYHVGPWVQPTHTLLLDLSQDEEKLFSDMKQKTRYNVRISDKRAVHVYEDHSSVGFEKFFTALQMTSRRQGIRIHGRPYYETFLQALSSFDMVRLYVAEHEGDVLATALCVGYGDTFSYVHGASTDVKRAFKAPERLQWEAIRQAKLAGFHFYDFFGVAPEDARRHKLRGVSKFKRGFGGFEYSYSNRGDIVFQPFFYWFFRIAVRIRRIFYFV